MARTKREEIPKSTRRMRPALTPEANENQMVALATNVAREQLLAGTASSQIIVHYLKLGTEQARLERVKLENEIALAQAKTEALQSAKNMEEVYSRAIKAMQIYSGHGDENEG